MPRLSSLAQQFHLELHSESDPEISEVAITAQFVKPAALFIAVAGAKHHGLDFLDQAIGSGAVALLTDRAGDYELPTLVHPNPREIAGELAAAVYGTEASELFAVTGTNGKTSTSYFLRRLLIAAGRPAGLISSAEQIIGEQVQSAELTTPEAPRLHQLLYQMRAAGESSCALEVSAQALVRNRVDGLGFVVSGFTNLSRDHLDDFGTMENYLAAKAELFKPGRSQLTVINIEDSWGQQLFDLVDIPKLSLGPGCDYDYSFDGELLSISGAQQLVIKFGGTALMAKNLALAAVMLLAAGIDVPNGSEVEHEVPGRLQLVSSKRPHVYVDYAHTPAGVAAAVAELRGQYPQLTVVLGASGNRDRGKRAEMALAAAPADLLVITDQHPRDEDPAEIRSQLVAAAKDSGIEYIEVPDPAEAIARAVAATGPEGAILWCGPGHLKYREIAGKKVAFDAIAIAQGELL